MTLCNRLIGGVVDGLMIAIDTITSRWQTPREVEWAKAAADGLAEREAEVEVWSPPGGNMQTVVLSTEVDEPRFGRCTCPYCRDDDDDTPRCYFCSEPGEYVCERCADPETSATTPGAESGPAEGEPPEPSAGADRDKGCSVSTPCGCPCVLDQHPDGYHACRHGDAFTRSAEVEPPASAPSAESPAPEFDWVTTAIPVIAGVLADHVPAPERDTERVHCYHPGDLWTVCGEFADWEDWRNHVAPHVAISIRLQTPRSATSYDFPSGDRPRPLADFPKHQK